jgi:iron complex outermembrane receptor protein
MACTQCGGIARLLHRTARWIRRSRWRVALALVFPAAFAAEGAFCAQPGSADAAALTEREFLTDVPMVLTVSRLAQPIEEAPAPVTVIDREMIKASGFRDLAQVFRLVPGFITVSQRGGFPAVMYGLDDDFARRMQVLVDGRSIYTPSFGGVEWSNLPLEIEDIDRIEVIRGPNAATYGANSFFGVINIITRHAAQDPGAFVSVTKGDHKVEHGVARYAGTSGALAYRISAGYHQDGGYKALYDTSRVKRVSLRTDYQLNDRDTLQFQAGYNEGTDALGRPRGVLDPERRMDIDSHFGQLRWQRTLSADSELALQYYHTRYRTRDECIAQIRTPPVSAPVDFNHEASRDNLELQHTLKPLPSLRMVWGGEVRSEEVRSPRYFNKSSVKNELQRVFGNAEWRVQPNLLLNVGAMWEDNDITGSDVSPRLALNYRVREGHTLRASISEANRMPVLLEEYSDTRVQVGPLLRRELFSSGNLRPEQIRTLELGYLGSLAQDKLTLDLRLHYDRVEDLIMQTGRIASRDGARDFKNAGDLALRGFETQIKYSPSERLRLIGNYAFLEIDTRAFNAAEGLDQAGFERLNEAMPRHNFGLLGLMRFNEKLHGSVGYYKISGADWPGGSPLPSTTKLDLRLAYRFNLGANAAEWQFVVQDIRDYVEFEPTNERDMRTYLNLGLQF